MVLLSGGLGLQSHSVICKKGLCYFSLKGLVNVMAGASTSVKFFCIPDLPRGQFQFVLNLSVLHTTKLGGGGSGSCTQGIFFK